MKVVKLPELTEDDPDTSVTFVCKFCDCTLLLEETDLDDLTAGCRNQPLECKVCKHSVHFAKDESDELADRVRRSTARRIVAELRDDAPKRMAVDEAVEAREADSCCTTMCMLFGLIAFIVGLCVRK